MKNIHAMAGGSVGYVRGLVSVRCGGVAFSLDLVRAVARTAARLAVRRRVGAAFSGYLVSDDERGYPFVNRREVHRLGVDRFGCVSPRMAEAIFGDRVKLFCGPLDAPEFIPAGGMRGFSVTALRLFYVSRGAA